MANKTGDKNPCSDPSHVTAPYRPKLLFYYYLLLSYRTCSKYLRVLHYKTTNVHPVGHYKERFNLEETFATVTQHCRPRCLTSCRVYRHYSRLALFKVSYITRRFVARIFSWELLPICLPFPILSSPPLNFLSLFSSPLILHHFSCPSPRLIATRQAGEHFCSQAVRAEPCRQMHFGATIV